MYELKIKFKPRQIAGAELVCNILNTLGVKKDDIVETVSADRSVLTAYFKTRSNAESIARSMRSLKIKGIAVSFKNLTDSSWKTRWKKYFKPFNITPDIRIVPAWKKFPLPERKCRVVYIDTTFAFGTGLHATTRMMAGLIRTRETHINKFLDIGTGSGILSLIALGYGAREVFCIDYDKKAVETAKRNFELNKCRADYLKTADFRSFHAKEKFDFIAANLLTEDLLRFKNKLVNCLAGKGYLAVSGIYRDNYPVFRKQFKVKGIVCKRVLKQKDWYALLFKKRI